ncbi:hypothetical protein TIFTF001_044539 [Ficus carica]|uniref:Uncharacterized protein n=1 Tax=Ficus carica TaxID=3494 RepID=A0AA88CQN5_FICCA|nr:hypothetical protein TIFTF001_044539 [Ficus carica]
MGLMSGPVVTCATSAGGSQPPSDPTSLPSNCGTWKTIGDNYGFFDIAEGLHTRDEEDED